MKNYLYELFAYAYRKVEYDCDVIISSNLFQQIQLPSEDKYCEINRKYLYKVTDRFFMSIPIKCITIDFEHIKDDKNVLLELSNLILSHNLPLIIQYSGYYNLYQMYGKNITHLKSIYLSDLSDLYNFETRKAIEEFKLLELI